MSMENFSNSVSLTTELFCHLNHKSSKLHPMINNVTEQARTRLAHARQRQGDRREVMLHRTAAEILESNISLTHPQS